MMAIPVPGRRGGLRTAARILAMIGFAALGLLIFREWPRSSLGEFAARSTAITARDGELLRLTLAADGRYRLWVPLDRMPKRLPAAVMLYEDRWFYLHPGVNPIALLRAMANNSRGARRLGASTITMQLARRLYGIDTRNPAGKMRQIAMALWLESRYGKRDILEAYLNLAPYGGNVEGAGAASLVFFGRPVAELSVPQIMALAVIPQNPRSRRLGAVAAGNALAAARDRLWIRWLNEHPVDARFTGDVAAAAPARSPDRLPFIAPHFTDAVLREHRGEVRTTLDPRSQASVERMLRGYVREQSDSGIRNAGALLLELRDGSADVRAYVGSADYTNPAIDGQVNAVTAKRSPGSTLKPFVYALALDQGLLHPRSILKDAPSSFGPYSPENFDGRFLGPIAAEDALIRSRNIPAVAVASRLSHPNLYDFLKASGVSRLNSERYYGLSLALGGGDVSMEELGRMYAVLLNGGRAPALRAVQPGFPDSPRSGPTAAGDDRLISEQASFIALDMLEKNPRPDTGQPASPAVAWKTGTSWGFHDAWSVGVFGRYVLVVWIGNFDNTGNPAFVGVQAAAPLFFRIVDALRNEGLEGAAGSRLPPHGINHIEVCAASGDLPNSDCPQTIATWYIPGKSPIKVSQLHRRLYIDAQGHRACAPGPGIHEEVYEFWTSDMLRLFREAGMPRRVPPPAPACRPGAVAGDPNGGATGEQSMIDAAVPSDDREAPQIVSPLRGVVYTLRIRDPQALALRANVDARTTATYWFADKAFLGRAEHGESLSWLPPLAGRYVLRAVDDSGTSDTRIVDVEIVP